MKITIRDSQWNKHNKIPVKQGVPLSTQQVNALVEVGKRLNISGLGDAALIRTVQKVADAAIKNPQALADAIKNS